MKIAIRNYFISTIYRHFRKGIYVNIGNVSFIKISPSTAMEVFFKLMFKGPRATQDGYYEDILA